MVTSSRPNWLDFNGERVVIENSTQRGRRYPRGNKSLDRPAQLRGPFAFPLADISVHARQSRNPGGARETNAFKLVQGESCRRRSAGTRSEEHTSELQSRL